MLEQIDNAAAQASQVYDHLLQSKDVIDSIEKQGQMMHKVMKKYQLAGFTQDQAFQLVLAQSADFKVQLG